jgi:hypothetical protein
MEGAAEPQWEGTLASNQMRRFRIPLWLGLGNGKPKGDLNPVNGYCTHVCMHACMHARMHACVEVK